jgi:UDP-2,4-diacetamido-2,4,6-trideoxy-beta-L-altropyranose hydrolase
MRCLALAEAWQESGHTAVFAVHEGIPAILEARIRAEGFDVFPIPPTRSEQEDASHFLQLAQAVQPAWVVLDGYECRATYQKEVKAAGYRVLFFDDYGHGSPYSADLVLNQNPVGIGPNDVLLDRYKQKESHSRLLLGAKFVLLRREFREWIGRIPETRENARRVLVTLGGADPNNVTQTVVAALALVRRTDLLTTVLIGAGNKFVEEVKAESDRLGFNVAIKTSIRDASVEMADCDLAIAAGGTTSLELAFLGRPMMLVVLADNQLHNSQTLEAAGAAVNAGRFDVLSASQLGESAEQVLASFQTREQMSRAGRRCVDGHGFARVMMHLKGEKIWLRKAESCDSRLLWNWANRPEVRSAAFATEAIPWESHLRWFEDRLNRANCRIFVAFNDSDDAVGQVRFDLMDPDKAEVDVSVDSTHEGQGLGSAIIRMAATELFREFPNVIVHAYIKAQNQASLRAFQKAGFSVESPETIRGFRATHYVLTRSQSL